MSIAFPLPPDLPDAELLRSVAQVPRSARPARRFHGATRHEADEAALQRWWQTMADPVLDRLVEACLKQNVELSLASLRVSEACAGSTGTLEEMATQPACLKAWSMFHTLRVRLAAATVRVYLDVLEFQERMACTDLAIRVHSAVLQRGRGASMDRIANGLPELQLHRAHLQGERDATVAGLAWLVGEPVDLVLSRVDGRVVPASACGLPAIGTPDDLLLRRPDLLAITLQRRSPEHPADRDARIEGIRHEQAVDRAVCGVERALAALAAAIAQSTPARAAALAAGNRAGALVRAMSAGPMNRDAIIDANRLYHAHCDREIEVRARGYRALADLYEAAGAGWPAPFETGEAR